MKSACLVHLGDRPQASSQVERQTSRKGGSRSRSLFRTLRLSRQSPFVSEISAARRGSHRHIAAAYFPWPGGGCVVNGEHLSPCLHRAAEGPRDDPRPPRFRCTRAVSVQTACYAARVVGGSAGRGGIPPVPRPRVRRRTEIGR